MEKADVMVTQKDSKFATCNTYLGSSQVLGLKSKAQPLATLRKKTSSSKLDYSAYHWNEPNASHGIHRTNSVCIRLTKKVKGRGHWKN